MYIVRCSFAGHDEPVIGSPSQQAAAIPFNYNSNAPAAVGSSAVQLQSPLTQAEEWYFDTEHLERILNG